MWDSLIGLLALLLMQVALNVDNVIFIGLLIGELPERERRKAWRFWIVYSPLISGLLLVGLHHFLRIEKSLFMVAGRSIGLRELLLLGGGVFLLYKGVREIHQRVEKSPTEEESLPRKARTLGSTLWQVALIDFVFSVDSVLTAIGMTRKLGIMLLAIGLAVLVMLFAAQKIQTFISRHPTLKMLALAFLLLIGFTLIGEGTGLHIPKGYIYFAMLFSLGVELLNLRAGLRAASLSPKAPPVASQE